MVVRLWTLDFLVRAWKEPRRMSSTVPVILRNRHILSLKNGDDKGNMKETFVKAQKTVRSL